MYRFKIWRPNNRFSFRVISISAKIWKTTFPKEFFNEIWLKLGDHKIRDKMREPKNQMLGTMEPPLMQLSVKTSAWIELRGICSDVLNSLNSFTISHCDIYVVEVCQKYFRIITVYEFEKCSQIQIIELIHLKKNVNIYHIYFSTSNVCILLAFYKWPPDIQNHIIIICSEIVSVKTRRTSGV